MEDSINILESKTDFKSTYDTLSFNFIKPIPENEPYKGGVTDKGQLNEGYCLEVHTIKPTQYTVPTTEEVQGEDEEWIFCTQKKEDHDELLKKIIDMKFKKQKELGLSYTTYKTDDTAGNQNGNKKEQGQTMQKFIDHSDENEFNDPQRSSNDGYWIVVQDWTQCSVKCGGGNQFKQLMCIPPKAGGKPCEGEPVRTRPCNPQPCPQPQSIDKLLGKSETASKLIANSTEVKIMPISTKPQRYDRCVILERDALITQLSTTGEKEKLPVRLVMNSKSIVAYSDDSYKNALKTFSLENTKVSNEKDVKTCFFLTDLYSKAEFCQLDCTASTGTFADEWIREVHIFRDLCNSKREVTEANMEEYQKKLNDLKSEFEQERQHKIKKDATQNEIKDLQKHVQETKAMSYYALQKEKKLEELLEKEEEERERMEIEELKIQMKQEEEKKGCLLSSLKEKELENELAAGHDKITEEIEEIRQKTKEKINILRKEAKEKLLQKRIINQRKLNQLRNSIIKIRTDTMKELQKATKEGDMEKCFKGTEDQESKINEYCTIAFLSDPTRLVDCKIIENFCYACCENEFGDGFTAKRDECYRKKCNIKEAAAVADKNCETKLIEKDNKIKALEEKIKGNSNNELKQNQTPNPLSNDSPNDSQTR